MKRIYTLLLFFYGLTIFSQVGIGTTSPNSTLDVRSSNQATPINTDGLLIPKVDAFPTTNPTSSQQGMLVYLTTAGSGKTAGFYYWDNPSSTWVAVSSSASIDTINIEDFLFDAYGGSGGNDNQYAFTPVGTSSDVDGTAALYTAYGAGNDYAGIHRLSTTTGATNKSSLGSFNFIDRIKIGAKEFTYEIRAKFNYAPTGTQTYISHLGLSNLASGAAASTVSSGVYFALTTAGLVGTCRNSTSTATTTSAFTISANTWYKLKTVINAAGTRADFYIDGNLLGSVSSNLPTNPMKFVFHIEKSVGTTAATCDVDYITWKMVR